MDFRKINPIECEAIIFDIDGVLVDVNKSYNQAITKTVENILDKRFNIKITTDFPFENLISKLRNTGGFNNDIDTAYSIILVILYCILINKMNIEKTIKIFYEIVERLDDKGKNSMEKELEKIGEINTIKKILKYPSNDDIISTIFNEIFYGPNLFEKQFNKQPKYYFDTPLISNDILIIKEETLNYLSKKFNGNLGLISGRSKVASYFTLGNLMNYFVKDACIFLEDEKKEYSKPDTFSLHKIFDNLKLRRVVYVGDSMADLLMVENFRKQTRKDTVFFCGVYGGGKDISLTITKKKLLESKNADIIVENVNDLPHILNNTKN